MWGGHAVSGNPYKVDVVPKADSSLVRVAKDGLKLWVVGKECRVDIDTRGAGPGEIEAECSGPTQTTLCRLLDKRDRTYTLRLFPVECGWHTLDVKYGGDPVSGSPFRIRVMDPPNPSAVQVSGPGIKDGVILSYQSQFVVETIGAGAGQLSVKVTGPKNGFKVEMQRCSEKDRTILCGYSPTEAGRYTISVRWSGVHVPNSPFDVRIFNNMNELHKWRPRKKSIDNRNSQDINGNRTNARVNIQSL